MFTEDADRVFRELARRRSAKFPPIVSQPVVEERKPKKHSVSKPRRRISKNTLAVPVT